LRSRDFSQMNQREVERLIEKQQNQEIGVSLGVENLEYELEELSETIEKYLGRFFKFFQGFLPGNENIMEKLNIPRFLYYESFFDIFWPR